MRVMALAFEIQDRVDDVLQRLRAGEIAVLRDVADEHDRHVAALGGEQQMRRDLAHLADAARGGLKPRGKDRLNRIDDDERRLEPLDLFEDALEAGFGEQVQRRPVDRQPLAAQLDLMLGLFARAVENGTDVARHVRGHLQQQRGFSDARLAAEQHERAGNDAATEDAIELGDARRNPRRVGGLDVAVELGGRAARHQAVAMIRRRGRRLRSGLFFDERVPCPAVGTAADPLRLLAAAFLADKDGLRGFHGDDGTSSELVGRW